MNKCDKKLKLLLDRLPNDKYITAEKLADGLNVSEKTVRTRIKELNWVLSSSGAHINSKYHCGYILEIADENKYKEFLSMFRLENNSIPNTSEERIDYLTEYILNANDYIKLDDVAESLYVSKNTLTNDLKKVEYLLNKYDIKLIRRPNYGIKIWGNEFDIRLCMANYLFMEDSFRLEKNKEEKNDKIKVIAKIVLIVIEKHGICLSETSFKSFIIQIYVALRRIEKKCIISYGDDVKGIDAYEIKISREIANRLEKEFKISIPEEEIKFIAIHVAGKRILGTYNQYEENRVIPQKINDLVSKMLDTVYNTFKIDFRSNFDLRTLLGQHLVPFDIRLKYGIVSKNLMIKEIKEKYMFAFTIASQACIPIKEEYNRELSEDEIGYIALLFALALEKNRSEITKKNILLVCSSGKVSAQLLAYRYKFEFEKYIKSVQVCDIYNLNKVDFSKFDYVFTTISIKETIPIPIFQVKTFLDDNEITTVRDILKSEHVDFFYHYYDKDLFLLDVPGKTKEDVIKYMCNHISKMREIPNNFYSAVLKRENLMHTDYGNFVALPHPYEMCTKDTFVCVAVLKEPIQWVENKVQVVFLVSIADKKNPNIQGFYQQTTKLIICKESILKLINEKKFSTLIELLSDGYKSKIV